jgi:hypothetical protein
MHFTLGASTLIETTVVGVVVDSVKLTSLFTSDAPVARPAMVVADVKVYVVAVVPPRGAMVIDAPAT